MFARLVCVNSHSFKVQSIFLFIFFILLRASLHVCVCPEMVVTVTNSSRRRVNTSAHGPRSGLICLALAARFFWRVSIHLAPGLTGARCHLAAQRALLLLPESAKHHSQLLACESCFCSIVIYGAYDGPVHQQTLAVFQKRRPLPGVAMLFSLFARIGLKIPPTTPHAMASECPEQQCDTKRNATTAPAT
ncbi:LAFE_0G06458g1_1 [Lachancea fermentati]|uniref:LAFE_0G06458g1_1 n=1 Tax=Lachancea fermentati TaxID=4955 RepID=A0A1G4MH75_LACFM|nr:LAFE_0G06458g1_1 [Lachancea fermentati]